MRSLVRFGLVLGLLFIFGLEIASGASLSAASGMAPAYPSQASATSSIYLPIMSKNCHTYLSYEIDEGVPVEEVNLIKAGICNVQANIQENFGGDISIDIKPSVRVRIVATGLGNQDPGGGGACCTALDPSGARLFFDVINSGYLGKDRSTVERKQIAAHEYAHAWQWSLGCLSFYNPVMGGWLNEGIAEYVAYSTYIRLGSMTLEGVRESQLRTAIGTGEADVALQTLEDPNTQDLWPGHIGYLAVEKLVSDSPLGEVAVRRVCENVGDGMSVDEAFLEAFGTTKSAFYADFPAYIDSLRSTPCTSVVPTPTSPANGSTQNSLAPLFEWRREFNPNATGFFLEFGLDPGFVQSAGLLDAHAQATQARILWNLSLATTYYWRSYFQCGAENGPFSETWSFTTGSGGTLPDSPTLRSPPNGTTLSSTSANLDWDSVYGATEYLVILRPVGTVGLPRRFVSETQIAVNDLLENMNYEWWVSARNDYGYSSDSQTWQFATP